jgi:hypothetical protein
LHGGIVAPEIASLVEFDRRVAELTAELKTLKTDAQIAEWHRHAAELIHDLEQAGLTQAAADLAARLEGGPWRWGVGSHGDRLAPVGYATALSTITHRLQDRIHNLLLEDMVSTRDEATPPAYKELVERYYQILSNGSAEK